jgi:hypothetical protein
LVVWGLVVWSFGDWSFGRLGIGRLVVWGYYKAVIGNFKCKDMFLLIADEVFYIKKYKIADANVCIYPTFYLFLHTK